MFAYNEWQSDWRQILNINRNCAKKKPWLSCSIFEGVGRSEFENCCEKKIQRLKLQYPLPSTWLKLTDSKPPLSFISFDLHAAWLKKKMLWLTPASQINIIFQIDCFPDYLCYFWYDRGSISSMFCSEETAPPPFFTLKALAGYHPVGKPQIGSLFVNFSAFLPAGTS